MVVITVETGQVCDYTRENLRATTWGFDNESTIERNILEMFAERRKSKVEQKKTMPLYNLHLRAISYRRSVHIYTSLYVSRKHSLFEARIEAVCGRTIMITVTTPIETDKDDNSERSRRRNV